MENLGKHRMLILAIIVVLISTTGIACQSGSEASPSTPAPVITPERSQTLILGDVSEDPAETITQFQPLADYLATNLTDFGIQQGNVIVASNLETMVNHLKNGEVDLYFDSPYPALTVYEEAKSVPLLRRWKDGVKEYHTLLITNKNSGITDLDGFLGKTLAFEDSGSTSGYLLPKAHLVNAGYKVTEQTASGDVADDEIGYVFAGTEENVLAWILQGKTQGGVIPNTNYEGLPAQDQDQLVILDQTVAVPRHMVLVRSTMDPELQERITKLLLQLHLTPEGQAILESFEETSQFDSLPGGADTALAELQRLFAPVR